MLLWLYTICQFRKISVFLPQNVDFFFYNTNESLQAKKISIIQTWSWPLYIIMTVTIKILVYTEKDLWQCLWSSCLALLFLKLNANNYTEFLMALMKRFTQFPHERWVNAEHVERTMPEHWTEFGERLWTLFYYEIQPEQFLSM